MTKINDKEILGCFEAISNITPNSEAAARDLERVREKLSEIFSANPVSKGLSMPLIMRSTIAKLAAVLIVAVVLLASLDKLRDSDSTRKPISCFTLLSRACAAERTIFTGEHIVHITNEIIVYPATDQNPVADRLNKLNLSESQRRYIETVSSWLDFNWMPICSLKADGQFRFHELKLSRDIDRPYTITDQAWYNPMTGRFARVMETGGKVIFANSHDGQAVYFSQRGADGSLRLLGERIKEDFNPPQNPAEFLGITAGLRSSFEHDDYAAISEITDDTLENGTPVKIYKQGFADLLGDINTYWLFKVRPDDGTIAEMEFVTAGSTRLIIRRVEARTVEESPHSWDLAEIEGRIGKTYLLRYLPGCPSRLSAMPLISPVRAAVCLASRIKPVTITTLSCFNHIHSTRSLHLSSNMHILYTRLRTGLSYGAAGPKNGGLSFISTALVLRLPKIEPVICCNRLPAHSRRWQLTVD